jgi:hypothetical protein
MSPYSAGEEAGFPEDTANRLVADGIAEIVKHTRTKLEEPKEEPKDKQMTSDKEGKKKYVTK